MIIMWFLFGIVTAIIASNKGQNGCGWLILGFLFGPFGLILALAASKNEVVVEKQAVSSGTMKKCPFCAELVRAEAVVCRYCQRDLLSLESSQGACPNCQKAIPLDSESCPKCKAQFGPNSAWRDLTLSSKK